MRGEVQKRKVVTRDELHSRILDSAARIKKPEDRIRRPKHELHTRDAKCIELDCWIFEHLLCTVTNLSFKHKIKIKIQLTANDFSCFITIRHAWCLFVDSNGSIS